MVRKSGRAEGSPAVVLAAFTLGAAAGLAWNIKEYDAWPDLFPLLPFAAVGIGGLFHALTRRLAPRTAVVVAVVLSVAAAGTAIRESVTTRDERLTIQRESVAAVLKQAPAGATITSVEAPQALVLTERTNPTRHQMFSSGLQDYIDDTWPGGRDGFRRRRSRPHSPTSSSFGDPMSKRWRAAFEPDYVYIGSAPDWHWYARASLGKDRIAALRAAAGYDPTDPLAQPRCPRAMTTRNRTAAALALGSAISGLLAYAVFVLITRGLGADAAAPVSVVWTYWAFAGAAFTFPLQHWITRSVVAGREGAVRRAAPRVWLVVCAAALVLGGLAWLVRDDLFHRYGPVVPGDDLAGHRRLRPHGSGPRRAGRTGQVRGARGEPGRRERPALRARGGAARRRRHQPGGLRPLPGRRSAGRRLWPSALRFSASQRRSIGPTSVRSPS